ncbi:transcription termination/antitermination NusG family protein [Paenibacillus polymyxa]|uniref:transcription termination/antitermination NusG family protein n=1 Tax=Paenibacillus polymyxa TaxID=1406 RepID=UPI002AB53F75|nr:transcription termination/antitermination NusG family protein [Paenibacillus polymyxa]MDY7989802.1 transcription termination/antitermination NusG family protein [Paenibacillus polymyxa]MDY8116839.1 transcription termination/antitermination NusG family protein [Paenibacillus polymyxa]
MGAAFAIQVMTGKESNVKKLMEWAFSKSENAQNWIKAIHTFSQGTRRLLDGGELGKEIKRAVMPGYIFLEMNYSVDDNNCSAYLSADVWHLIKSIPGVLKQFTGSGQIIGAEEFHKMLGLDTEEQVEISVPVQEIGSEASKVNEAERNMKNALHQVNTASTEEERVQAEQALEVAEQQMNEMIEREYEESVGAVAAELKEIQHAAGSNSVVSKIKAFLRNSKEIVRLPKTLLEKIIMRTDSQSKLPPYTVVDQLFKLFKHLRQQLGTS